MLLFSQKTNPPRREDFIRKALKQAQENYQRAYTGMQNVSEPDLIDSYIYELNAAHMRYRVLLRDFKMLQNEKKRKQ